MIIFLIERVIERTLKIEFFNAGREGRIIYRFDDARILKQIHKSALRNQLSDFRIASQPDDFWMLGQFARTRECQKFLRPFRTGKNAPCFPQRFVRPLRNWVGVLKHASK